MPSTRIPKQTINFTLAPFVKPFDILRGDARNHIVEDPVEMICNASVPTKDGAIAWYRDGQPLNTSNAALMNETNTGAAEPPRVTVSTAPIEGNTEWLLSILKISNVQSEDAGKYTCRVLSPRDSESYSQQLTLKVKDKFAALYPFVAILAEVIILVVIIFMYERRHNRKAALEYSRGEDDEESQPVNSTRHH